MDTSTLEGRVRSITGEWERLPRRTKIKRVILLTILLALPGGLILWVYILHRWTKRRD